MKLAPQSVFITGTDTEIGKTYCSAALIRHWSSRTSVAPMKPIASGCEDTAQGLRNADAEALIEASGYTGPYDLVNRFAFAPPVAPHLAALQAGKEISVAAIAQDFDQLRQKHDVVVVEGVGGWAVPLSGEHMLADIPRRLNIPVLLVVGMRLGCLNHALLTAAQIQADGCALVGWIANTIDPEMNLYEENLAELRARLPAPLIGICPYQSCSILVPATH